MEGWRGLAWVIRLHTLGALLRRGVNSAGTHLGAGNAEEPAVGAALLLAGAGMIPSDQQARGGCMVAGCIWCQPISHHLVCLLSWVIMVGPEATRRAPTGSYMATRGAPCSPPYVE